MEEFKAKALEYLNNLEVFTNKEVPEYFKELLNYKKTIEIVSIIVCALGLAGLSYLVYKGTGMVETKYNDRVEITGPGIACILLGGLGGLFFGCSLFQSVTNLLEVVLAPRVYIVKHLSKLIK